MHSNIAKPPSVWQESRAKTVTFMVTEDCQLRCRYCYFTGKNSSNTMSFDIAKRSIDYIIKNGDIFSEKSIVWDFIGGEPFLEIALIDRICEYIKTTQLSEMHPWHNSYRFSFTSNGLLYNNEQVQNYIKKNKSNLSIGITLDGTPEKHDMHRIYPSGKGSYDDTKKNIPLWLQQFPNGSTKVTVTSADLPFIKESVLHLYSLGIKHISINVVFENVWKDGDDIVFENQLIQLADHIINEKLYRDYTCSFFSETIGHPVIDNHNWCGAGKMLTIDYKGDFYPCHRFTPPSLSKRQALPVGNCFEGIDKNKLRPFLSLDLRTQSSDECIHCEVATGCAWCQGANYDVAETDTIFQRATFLCKMHKARVRANNYYWHQLNRQLLSE